MLIVAGLSLKNLKPHVWDPHSPFHMYRRPGGASLRAVMVSYGDFHRMPARRRKAMEQGLRSYLDVPEGVSIYLDNGAFSFIRRQQETPRDEYEEFVLRAQPDWWPIPQDYIPLPGMSRDERRECLERTMSVNRSYSRDALPGRLYVPIIHVSDMIGEYLKLTMADSRLARASEVGLGGLVPNLLRAPRARPYDDLIADLRQVRRTLSDKRLHLFGVGGTATLHLAALLGMDSVDSSGWRNRAARGIIQLPGRGDRLVAELGNWSGKEPSAFEWDMLDGCPCPACASHGINGLTSGGVTGFSIRATHNLWVLLNEAAEIERRLSDGTYNSWYETHLVNSTYLPLIRRLVSTEMN